MSKLIRFENLREGQSIKVEGKYCKNGKVIAVEINLRPPENNDVIIGMIEKVDRQNQRLRIFGNDFFLKNGIEIRDLNYNRTGIDALDSQAMVKLKGKYTAFEGFVTEKLKLQETLAFNIDKLKGKIEKIDREAGTLKINGITISVNDQTTIEGD